jgi:hypothetical protein
MGLPHFNKNMHCGIHLLFHRSGKHKKRIVVQAALDKEQDPLSKRAGNVAQVLSPEFKPQYYWVF